MTTAEMTETAGFPPLVADGVRAAVESTFASICGAPLTLVPGGSPQPGEGGIVGIISFLGDISWSFSQTLSRETASALVLKFAGFEIPFESPDMCDAVGELVNVVAGDIVAQLDRRGIKAKMSLPMVARGTDLEIFPPAGVSSLSVACRSVQGTFWYGLATAKTARFGRQPGT